MILELFEYLLIHGVIGLLRKHPRDVRSVGARPSFRVRLADAASFVQYPYSSPNLLNTTAESK